MADFEQITDTIEEAPKKTMKFLKKNKVFAIGLVAVVAYALYVASKKSETSETVETYAYTPTSYDGYPELSESYYSSVGDSLSSGSSEQILSDVSQIVNDIMIENDRYISEIVETFETERLNYNETLSYLEEQREKESIINQMSNNSTMWALTDDVSQKDALHQQNLELGTSLGATYDSNTGTWWLDGERLYISPVEQSNSTTLNTNPTSTGDITKVSYDPNVDYAQKIIDAKASGASQAEIDYLTAQRNAKIQGENLNDDGTKKTTTNVSSSSSSSSSSKSSSSSSSSSSGHYDTVTPSNASTSAYVVYNPKTGKLNYSATKQAEMNAKKKK